MAVSRTEGPMFGKCSDIKSLTWISGHPHLSLTNSTLPPFLTSLSTFTTYFHLPTFSPCPSLTTLLINRTTYVAVPANFLALLPNLENLAWCSIHQKPDRLDLLDNAPDLRLRRVLLRGEDITLPRLVAVLHHLPRNLTFQTPFPPNLSEIERWCSERGIAFQSMQEDEDEAFDPQLWAMS